MKALRFERSVPRFAAARLAGSLAHGRGATVGPLRLRDVDLPDLPGPGWQRVRPRLAGICGSDLATIDATSSRWFEPIVSFPFVPGHEVVGDLDDGTRVVLQPVLGCAARGIEPPCDACTSGQVGRCANIAFGHLDPGLQTGYCAATGGGWSTALVAHDSQLHRVPDALSDEAAVMVEPTACAVRGAFRAGTDATTVAVIGAGTLGLCTIAALRRLVLTDDQHIVAAAKHPEQRALARELGATTVVEPDQLDRVARRLTGSMATGDGEIGRLTGGVDVTVDCVGSADSLAQALAVTAPGGRIVMVGMPGRLTVDLTPLWHREIELVGAYAYGVEPTGRPTFDLAFELVADAGLERLVSATYPLDRFTDAIAHAAEAGRRGAVKIAFDLRTEKERDRL
ncbi:MAG TPA: zinc-binding dehydrogenase [Acidimicrobiales bacterium]|nr:zinc-binding dehydrogenase [Acidimicrobiales bacterium]